MVNGKPIVRWLRDSSPLTIYRLLLFSPCATCPEPVEGCAVLCAIYLGPKDQVFDVE